MSSSEYKVDLKLVASVVVPEGKFGSEAPEQVWDLEIGKLGGIVVPAHTLAACEPMDIEGVDGERLTVVVGDAFCQAVNVAIAIELGELDVERVHEFAKEHGVGFQVSGNFGEATSGRFLEKGLVPVMRGGAV